MSTTNTRPSTVDRGSELFIQNQYMKGEAIHLQFALAAMAETGRFLDDPWDTDVTEFHEHMMMYLNL